MTPLFRLYDYVGPEEIRLRVQGHPAGQVVAGPGELRDALSAIAPRNRSEITVTYVVDHHGQFRIADRCSEHIACAAHAPVFAAGEITFLEGDGQFYADELTNLSTGFCPETTCWDALDFALRAAAIPHPDHWTHAFEFRLCSRCGRSVIKNDDSSCAECEVVLASQWNFSKTYIYRAFFNAPDTLWILDTMEEGASAGQDRVAVVPTENGLTLMVADGAGGTSGGRAAADAAVAELSELARRAEPAQSLVKVLGELDKTLEAAAGQTTTVVCEVALSAFLQVYGASVGDSKAFTVTGNVFEELTEHQCRKPLLGTGHAKPREFCTGGGAHALLLGSDGLFNYADWQQLKAWTTDESPDAPWRLVDLARLPSDGLSDDFSAVWLRRVS